MEVLRNALEAAFLVPCCMQDVKKKAVPAWYFAAGAAGAVLYMILLSIRERDPGITELLWAMGPGLLLILLSFFTEGKVGYGDGICLLVVGGFERSGAAMLVLFSAALVLSAAVSIMLLIFRKAGKTTRIPFIPFILAAKIMTAVFIRQAG